MAFSGNSAWTVVDIADGPAMASVKVDVNSGGLTAAITADAVKDIGPTGGSSVDALIKATEVSLTAA